MIHVPRTHSCLRSRSTRRPLNSSRAALIRDGVHGLVLMGTVGVGDSLSAQEKHSVPRTLATGVMSAIDAVDGSSTGDFWVSDLSGHAAEALGTTARRFTAQKLYPWCSLEARPGTASPACMECRPTGVLMAKGRKPDDSGLQPARRQGGIVDSPDKASIEPFR